MSKFTPPNYETHPDDSHKINDKGRVKCACGRKVWPFVLVNVKQFDNIAQDWACDGCWTLWQRKRIPLMKPDKNMNPLLWDKNDIVSRHAWDEVWFKGHGAPQDVIDTMKHTMRRA